MASYQEARVTLTNIQLNKLKSKAKNKTETILRLNKKNFEDEDLHMNYFQQEDKQLKSEMPCY